MASFLSSLSLNVIQRISMFYLSYKKTESKSANSGVAGSSINIINNGINNSDNSNNNIRLEHLFPLPFIEADTLSEATALAQKTASYLLIYLHNGYHPDTPRFVSEILTHRTVVDKLNHIGALVWVVDVATPPGMALQHKWGVESYPYLAMFIKGCFIGDIQGIRGSSSKSVKTTVTIERTNTLGGEKEGLNAADTGVDNNSSNVAFDKDVNSGKVSDGGDFKSVKEEEKAKEVKSDGRSDLSDSSPHPPAVSKELLLEFITRCEAVAYPIKMREVVFVSEREGRERERLYSDAQLEEARKHDLERIQQLEEERRKMEQAEKAEAVRLTMEARKAEKERVVREKFNKIKEKATSLVPEEPPLVVDNNISNNNTITTVRIIDLKGKSVERRFSVTDDVEVLYYYAITKLEDEYCFEIKDINEEQEEDDDGVNKEYDKEYSDREKANRLQEISLEQIELPFELIAGYPPKVIERNRNNNGVKVKLADISCLIPKCVVKMRPKKIIK